MKGLVLGFIESIFSGLLTDLISWAVTKWNRNKLKTRAKNAENTATEKHLEKELVEKDAELKYRTKRRLEKLRRPVKEFRKFKEEMKELR